MKHGSLTDGWESFLIINANQQLSSDSCFKKLDK